MPLIGFQRRKSDRTVLSCVGVFVIGALLLVAVVVACLFWEGRWRPQVGRDRRALDGILATQHIDRVAIFDASKTNWFTGSEAQDFVGSLHATNRVPNIDWTKQQVQVVVLFNGTNQVAVLSLGEDGAWEFGAYGFRLGR